MTLKRRTLLPVFSPKFPIRYWLFFKFVLFFCYFLLSPSPSGLQLTQSQKSILIYRIRVGRSCFNIFVLEFPPPFSNLFRSETKILSPPSFVSSVSCVLSAPAHRTGISHLASVRIVGNKGYPRRSQSVNRGGKIQNDVNLLSYYLKNRKAAAQHQAAPLVLASGTSRI